MLLALRVPFHHRPGVFEVYVVLVQEHGRPDDEAFEFADPDDAFDKCEDLAANGCACHVVRRWRIT